ncbi:MAG TPA: class I SAM-dependent methyltransferase [Steroidobacter sp.]|uniref:class I SAM-dependent methyltransferase n=1 Tax=Steroidobacter sp. TaxID=1978227 RepID=UPI002ED7EF7B
MSTQTASAFWKAQTEYPFAFTRKRRIHELNYLVPRLAKVSGKRLLDLGCGDGSLLECLLRLTDFEEFYGYDIAADLLRDIDPRVRTAVFDIAQPGDLPQVDAAIVAGVIQYVFDDSVVDALFARLTAPIVWVRSTCTLQSQAERVVKDGYASNYRTLPETIALLSRHHQVTAVDRIYPDELESAFGTKQFYFEARRRT